MNRNEEFDRLLDDMDAAAPDMDSVLKKAGGRLKRRNRLYRPAAGLAGFFACFVLLVNFCAPVAYACSRVPGLRELAEAVTFSRSLGDAVENEYVQPIELEKSDNGITARVEYLIVDQKQVNVFFRLESDEYESFGAEAEFFREDGKTHIGSCTYGTNEYYAPEGELRSASIELIEGDVPEKLAMTLAVFRPGDTQAVAPAESGDYTAEDGREPEKLASFDFLLEFDPDFTETGRIIEVGKTFELDGQRLTVTRVEVYPTHLRLELDDNPENTAWLVGLDFYIQTETGERFDTVKNGLVATGREGSPMMESYRADSSFFYDAEHLELVITGAEWLDKDMERIHVDLADAGADAMPEGAQLYSAERTENGWTVSVIAEKRREGHMHQVFSGEYYDPNGERHYINEWSVAGWSSTSWIEGEENEKYFMEKFPITDYPFDEVWLCPHYSRTWTSEEGVRIELS